jgi:hypothetical protein
MGLATVYDENCRPRQRRGHYSNRSVKGRLLGPSLFRPEIE